MGLDKGFHFGVDLFTPAATTEDAVMACAFDFHVVMLLAHDAFAQVVCGFGLA